MDQPSQDLRRQRALRLKATRDADERLIAAIFGETVFDGLSPVTPRSTKTGHTVPSVVTDRGLLGG